MAVVMSGMLIVYFDISDDSEKCFDFRHESACNMRTEIEMHRTVFRNMHPPSGVIMIGLSAAFRADNTPQLFVGIGYFRLCKRFWIFTLFKID